MFHYMVWTLAPNLDSLTLYHDDIALSKGLLRPPSTLLAAMGLAGMLGVAIWQRAIRPLLTLGICWFFGGHLLTGTIIPLLLVFEHRNYFPSVGLLLAASSLVALEGSVIKARALAIAAASLFSFYALTTLLRSLEWSNPLQLAASDAVKRPDSSASQYEYARTLFGSTLDGDPKPMQAKAFAILERMAANPDAEATHNQLLIVYSSDLKRPINPEWWESMIAKLSTRPATSTEATALVALLKCFDTEFCARDVDHLHRAFAAATSHAGGYAIMYSAYGRFAQRYLEDTELAERQFREAVNQAPKDPETLISLADFLIQTGQLDEAEIVVGRVAGMNHFGLLDDRLSRLSQDLAETRGLR
jgi:tetratricopeptide (TPR) repeat protein